MPRILQFDSRTTHINNAGNHLNLVDGWKQKTL